VPIISLFFGEVSRCYSLAILSTALIALPMVSSTALTISLRPVIWANEFGRESANQSTERSLKWTYQLPAEAVVSQFRAVASFPYVSCRVLQASFCTLGTWWNYLRR